MAPEASQGNPYFRIPVTFSIALLCYSVVLNRSLPETVKQAWYSISGTTPPKPAGPPKEVADYILYNASIWTGVEERPWAEMIAVKCDSIMYAGREWAAEDLLGPKTERVDLQGSFVAPGFIDSHLHFIDGGLQLSRIDLKGVKSREEFAFAVAEGVAKAEAGQWVLGRGWDHEAWGGQLPDASWIDHVSPNNPVWLPRVCGHMGLANHVALAKASITRDTSDPEGGTIERGTSGELTGLLKETAIPILTTHIPRPSREERHAALKLASEHALSRGVTAVGDMSTFAPGDDPKDAWDDLVYVYGIAAEKKDMSVRVYSFVPLESWSKLVKLIAKRGRHLGEFLRWGGLKAYADGSLGSSTAYFHEPYVGEGNNRGLQVADPKWLKEAVVDADKAGLQVAIHAIGDAANSQCLDAYQAAVDANGHRRDRRWRIEHAQHLSQDAPARFAALGVIASPQPQHLLEDSAYAERRLGKERAEQSSFLFGTLLDHHIPLALGSDWPVASLDPLMGIHAAAWRSPLDKSTEPWIAKQQITPEQALIGYTRSAAHAMFWEDKIGTIAKGKLADFVVLSKSPLKKERVDRLPEVLRTYVGGKCRHGCEAELPPRHEEL